MNARRRICAAAGACALGVAVAALPARGGVHDDAAIWFRGGWDANGDGTLQADEFVDTAHAKSETAFQTCTITGGGSVGYAKGGVWSAYNPTATNVQSYLSFPNGDAADAASCVGLKAVNPYAGTTDTASRYTIHLRFRWDGKISPAAAADGNKMVIFSNGVNTWGQSGFRMALKYFEETSDFAVYWQFGANANGANATRDPTVTDGITLTPGEWNDWFITVIDYGTDHNAYADVVRLSPGNVSRYNANRIWNRDPWLSAWKSGGWYRCCSIKMTSGSSFLVADASFSGDVAAWTFWPRVLSEDEMRLAATGVRPGDAIFRLGVADGSSREFAAEGAGASSVDAQETWDAVPSRVKAGDTLDIRFAVDAQSANLEQVLRVKAAEGSAVVTAQIATYNSATQTCGAFTRLKTRRASTSHDALFFVRKDLLAAGDHVVRLSFANDLSLDAIELGGSWTLGTISWTLNKTEGVFTCASNATTGYDLATGNWNLMNGSLAADEDPLTDAATTIRFNVPADMVGCARDFTISANQFKGGTVDAIRVYVNDTLVKEFGGDGNPQWQYCCFTCEIPSSAVVAGENAIRIRRVTTTEAWWGGARGYNLTVKDAPNPDPLGGMFIVR